MIARKKRLIPYIMDTKSSQVAVSKKHEILLDEMAKGFGKDTHHIKTQADLGMAILTAWVGGSLKLMKKSIE